MIARTLEPGDVVYLPRGWIHAARANAGLSLHLTFGIHPYTRRDLADLLVAPALDDSPAGRDPLDASLPLGFDPSDPQQLDPALSSVRADVLARLAGVGPASLSTASSAAGRRTADRTRCGRSASCSRLTTSDPQGTPRATTVLRARPGLPLRVETATDGVTLVAGGRPSRSRPPMRAPCASLAAGAAFRAEELVGLDARRAAPAGARPPPGRGRGRHERVRVTGQEPPPDRPPQRPLAVLGPGPRPPRRPRRVCAPDPGPSCWSRNPGRGAPNRTRPVVFRPPVVDALHGWARELSARLLLIRRPGRVVGGARTWALADVTTRSLRVGQVSDVAELAAFDPTSDGAPETVPWYLVCAQGRHDVCCALRGRPVARRLQELRAGAVWECSHVGGDRFAANVLVLPEGLMYGYVDEAVVQDLVERQGQGRLLTEHLRGQCGSAPAAQVAEDAVRRVVDDDGMRAVTVDVRGPPGRRRVADPADPRPQPATLRGRGRRDARGGRRTG